MCRPPSVQVGSKGPEAPEAEQARLRAAAGEAADAVEFLGGVSDEEYAATASRAEGFGLPVVEAMVAGTPVAISDIPIFREIAGEDAEYFAADSPADAARAIRALGDDGLEAVVIAAVAVDGDDGLGVGGPVVPPPRERAPDDRLLLAHGDARERGGVRRGGHPGRLTRQEG